MRMFMRVMATACGFMIGATAPAALADSITWTAGGGGNTNWSNTANWSHAGDPAGHDVTFNTNGLKASGDTSVCDADTSLNILHYRFNHNSSIHQTRIPAGVTLTLSNTVSATTSLWVRSTSDGQYTRVTMVGDGTLAISGGVCNVGNRWTTSTDADRARLNMAGLREFVATVGGFYIGAGPDGAAAYGYRGLVELAATNTIVASQLEVGTTGLNNDGMGVGTLRLGETNAIRCSTIYIGTGRNSVGKIEFRTGLTAPAVTIRATDGVSAANLTLGRSAGSSTAAYGTLDLSGGTADALFGTALIGVAGAGTTSGSGANGTLITGGGTVRATTVTVGGQTGSTIYGYGKGYLTVGGTGTFTADLLTIGDKPSSSASVTGTVTIAGGRLEAIAVTNGAGSATRSIQFQGGILANKSGTNLTVAATIPITLSTESNHVFDVESSRTSTVNSVIGEFGSPVGPLVKTGTGTLVLAGANSFTSGLIVSNGAVTLTGAMTNASARVESGGSLSGSGTVTFNISGAASDPGLLCNGGTMDLSGFTLAFAGLTPTADSYTIATNAGGALTLPFASVSGQPAGYTLTNIANTEVRLVKDATVAVVITVQSNLTYATGNTLTIGWTTDLEVGGWLAYRVDGSLDDYALSPLTPEGTNHSVTLSGLVELTDYDVVIWSSASSLPYPMSTLVSDPTASDTVWTSVATTNASDWRWQRGANWNVMQQPGTNSLATFTHVGLSNTNAAGDTAVVDTHADIKALVFNFTNTTLQHQVRIDDGVSLTAERASGDILTVGGGGTALRTRVTFTGGGTLSLVGAGSTVAIGNFGTVIGAGTETVADLARLDLSGLDTFTAQAGTFGVGYHSTLFGGDGDGYRGWLNLAATNLITATNLYIGAPTGQGGHFGVVRLGLTNTLNVGTLRAGYSKGRGWLYFAQTNAGATVTIRGSSGGSSRATVAAGWADGNSGWTSMGTLDFTGGTVDARLSTVNAGRNTDGLSGTGILAMDAGLIDATTLNLGYSAGAGNASGTLTIGGTGSVTAGTLTLGHKGSSGAATGTINLNGGTLVAGIITNGASTGTRILNWTGGTLSATACYLGSVTQNHATATLSPGLDAVATNRFAGDFVLTAGQWDMDVDADNGVSDRIEVVGTLDLSGANDLLNIRLVNGPVLEPIVIATYGTLSGRFDSMPGYARRINYQYQGNQIAILPPAGTLFSFR